MLIEQAIEKFPERGRMADLLSTPVAVSLRDTGGSCVVTNRDGAIVVEAGGGDAAGVRIDGVTRHLVAVTQISMLSPLVPIGLITERPGRGLVRDLARQQLRIRGLLRHYGTTSRFLFLININTR
ncbi:MAG: hypothetical protein ACYCV7_04270 [Acidimicrobiales bacterium]